MSNESRVSKDPMWLKAREIISKHFPHAVLSDDRIAMGDRLRILRQTMSIPAFDLDRYCRWYKTRKAPTKSFTLGLFLYPDMIDEYRADVTYRAKENSLDMRAYWDDPDRKRQAEESRRSLRRYSEAGEDVIRDRAKSSKRRSEDED